MSFKDEEIEAANSASVAADLDPDTGIEIDRYGRYRLPKPPAERNGIMPVPATGRTRSFTRVTTLVSALEYAGSLTEWKLRRVTEGLGRRHDLWLRARAAGMRPEVDEDELRVVIPEAFAAGGGDVGASRGTAIHAATVALDHGHDRPPVDPGDHEAVLVDRDLTAYQLLLEDARITVPDLAELAGTGTEELVCVLPGLEVAGRFDKIRMIDGRLVIVDLKTEKDRPGTYGGLKVAMQLACYARAEWIYDQKEKVYRPIPAVSRDIGYVIWLPRGRGIAELLSIDLRTGWHWVRTAVEVRASRRVKDLVIPHSRADVTALTPTPPRPEVVAQIPEPEPESSAPPQPPAPAPASAPVQAETSRKPGRRCGKCGQPGHNARTCIGAPPSPDPKVKDLGNGLALCRHTSGWTRR
ncbi:MAG TPA: PD-(D/E)XK nuclease family protein, partial [Candidatus Bathyarchaeia archaeon]|nr:PD-(D/E)XK nuclease family protein [Candidatus Bathyarchaeia archaeon]